MLMRAAKGPARCGATGSRSERQQRRRLGVAMSPPATTSEASSAPGSDGLNRIGGRSAVLVGSGPAGRRGHWGERAAHARELRDRAHLRRRQALSPLDFRAHAVTEYDNHPIGVLIAHCGHLLPMVVEVDAAPRGALPCLHAGSRPDYHHTPGPVSGDRVPAAVRACPPTIAGRPGITPTGPTGSGCNLGPARRRRHHQILEAPRCIKWVWSGVAG